MSAPIINNQTFDVSESSRIGTSVGAVVATDPDGDALTYRVLDQDVPFQFRDSTSRLVTTELLDYETCNKYVFQVEASDGEYVVKAIITVNVIDVPEPVHKSIKSHNGKILTLNSKWLKG